MRAALLRQIPGKLEIDEVEVSSPGPHEVLIRTVAAGLCHSDLHFMEGKYPYPTPAVLGHESAGVVEAVGDQVTYVQPGDHVITCLSVYCGNCEPCLTGHLSLCQGKDAVRRPPGAEPRHTACRPGGVPVARHVSFAEQMLVHEHGLVKIRDDMPLDRAALIGCAVTTGVGAVFNTAKVRAGLHGRRDRVRRRRPQLHPGRGHRRRGQGHRRRHARVEARPGAPVRRHPHRRRVAGRPRRAGA